MKSEVIVEEGFVFKDETHLTISKNSLFFAGDGYTAYDCKGELIFRVDSYGHDARDTGEVVLMDASGRCLLTVRRKRPSLHHRWEGFVGERINGDGQKPIFSVRRSSMIGRFSVAVEVNNNPGEEYQIEGSFSNRHCTIFNAEKEIVAEIRRKVDTSTNVVLGKDVLLLALKPGFDGAFGMGLVLVLDQINGDGLADENPTNEDATCSS
ncbi:unnamed protein product [Fraxinus pennsylvanica]|uniref:Uncharacterized protein n=1 Tax=Fraxinus pennsylvanica TaxID=56036 RepID=A0AAD1ZDE0_9LAMI|nr:unnamed protein product [Fraxinus pennsylvanica]